jgi:hypothetical protein
MARRNRSGLIPAIYPLVALAVAVAFLPSALRPPPERTNDSPSLNPNAPPDDQAQEIIQATRQAQGGAGSDETAAATTTTSVPAATKLASGRCFGNPLRQTESVYSAPCAPAWAGDNGGATGLNVFPNEVRIGLYHAAVDVDEGPIPTSPQNNESAASRTLRILQQYVNNRFQTFGRRVRFYALSGDDDPASNQAEAKKAIQQHRILIASHLNLPFCEEFVREGGAAFCNPQVQRVYARNQPGLYSFMLDRTRAASFGAEFVCKKVREGKAVYSGTERNRDRKIGLVTESQIDSANVPPEEYEAALKKECGASYGSRTYQVGGADPGVATSAVAQMRASGVTTVVLEVGVVNTLLMMTAAEAVGWQPEWVMVSPEALDFATNARLLPATQSAHLFGLTAWEAQRRIEETECYQAYKDLDPDNDPDDGVCRLFWHTIILFADGIQQAGPRLNRDSFVRGLYSLGSRYPAEPWAIGGGFGPDDFSYMDDVSEVWFSATAINPSTGQPGAYVFSYGAKRFRRGAIPADDSQLFKHGVTSPGGADVGA